MKSPFKFPDSYTKDDRDIFLGREREIEELSGNYISPLQGFDLYYSKRWMLSIAKMLCAYSAIFELRHNALKGHHIIEQGNARLNNTIQLFALKGLHITEEGNALLNRCKS